MAYFIPQNISLSLHPIKSLFDFKRLEDISPKKSAAISFTFNTNSFLIANERGDMVSSPGEYILSFENGIGEALHLPMSIQGEELVVRKFPEIAKQ